jgi:hypothetical protein
MKALEVRIDSQQSSSMDLVEWDVIDFTEKKLRLQLFFKDPLSISSERQQKISLKVLLPKLFVTKSNTYLLQGWDKVEVYQDVPPQLLS